jgi:hypothetical protein
MHEHYVHSEGHAHDHGADACCTPSANAVPKLAFRSGRAYKVRGLDCAEEVAVLRQAIGPLVGGPDRLAFDVLNGRMTIADAASDVGEEAIIKAVAATGMRATAWTAHAGKDEADTHRQEQLFFSAASGALLSMSSSPEDLYKPGNFSAYMPGSQRPGLKFSRISLRLSLADGTQCR